ncbi:hypothetical protein PGT21_018450 [Puccinia graminis f. sp. tritici]|uniref:Uncharacterized protein n=1 Tax=Puccinia graminis f. sp. tritici TaxID=56615 RepID=A0A5B0LKU8_PUCGR|nr:hypothetical protein PGT21_018450 [Puccinia graminis f. sp. tritici]
MAREWNTQTSVLQHTHILPEISEIEIIPLCKEMVPTCLHSAHHECMTNMLENFANCPHCMKMLFGNKINQVMEIHDMAKSICDSNKKLYLYILGLSVFSLFLVLEKFF